MFVLDSGLYCKGQSGFFSLQFNSGIGIRAKQSSIDTTCIPNLYTGANCTSQYYQMKNEWYSQILSSYNFSVRGLSSSNFLVGLGAVFYRTRFGLIPEWKEYFHTRYPNELTDSIIHWNVSPIVQVGISQNLLPDRLNFILNLYLQAFTRMSSKFYSNNQLLSSNKLTVGGIYHIQTGFEYSFSHKNQIYFIWDAPIFFNSGYRSSKWIFMLGYRFCFSKTKN